MPRSPVYPLCSPLFTHVHAWWLTQQPVAAKSSPPEWKALRLKFLPLFLLLRLSEWLQGPYFYAVYAAKVLPSGEPIPVTLISYLFLTGFLSTGIFGPALGRWTDATGRKAGTLLLCVFYSLGALSTQASLLPLLFAGRVMSGLGTSLLFSAPESWLASEAEKLDNVQHPDELSKVSASKCARNTRCWPRPFLSFCYSL